MALPQHNIPTLDHARAWVYSKNPEEPGYFIYPRLDEEGFSDDIGNPTALSLGDFYWKLDKIQKKGHDTSFSRFTHWVTPPGADGYPQEIYDGDIVKITWIENDGHLELTKWYNVSFFGSEGHWCLEEIDNGDNDTEYIQLPLLHILPRKIKSMSIVGHRWKKLTPPIPTH